MDHKPAEIPSTTLRRVEYLGMIIDSPKQDIPARAKDQVPKRIDPQGQGEERTINSPLYEAIREDGGLLRGCSLLPVSFETTARQFI